MTSRRHRTQHASLRYTSARELATGPEDRGRGTGRMRQPCSRPQQSTMQARGVVLVRMIGAANKNQPVLVEDTGLVECQDQIIVDSFPSRLPLRHQVVVGLVFA